ncbi:MAG: flippase [Caldilineae bacterium]|nr:MAG: flippase [Caldilineae bacterium]
MSTTRAVARNTLFLSLAQGIRIVLGFVLILYIANVYGPVWQGKFSILLAFLNIFMVLGSFGMPRLITRQVARAFALGNQYFWAGLVAQGITTLGFMLVMVAVVALMPYPADTRAMLWLAVLALPLFTLYSVSGALLRAHERMQFLVYAEVLSAVAQLVVAITLLSAGFGVMALAIIRISGIGLAALTVFASAAALRYIGRPLLDLPFAWRLLRESFDFFGMAAFDAILQRMDVLILSVVAGEAATGIYDAAFQLIKVLMTLVLSFTDAVYPALSRLYVQARDRFALVTSKALQYGLILLLPVAVGITLLAPDVIALLYRKPGYGASGRVLGVLGWVLVAYFVQILLTRTLMAGDRPRRAFAITAVMVATGALTLLALSAWMGAAGTALALLFNYLLGAYLSWRACRPYRLTLHPTSLLRPASAAAGMALVLIAVSGRPLWFSVPLGGLLYGGLALLLRVFDHGDMQVLRALLRRS